MTPLPFQPGRCLGAPAVQALTGHGRKIGGVPVVKFSAGAGTVGLLRAVGLSKVPGEIRAAARMNQTFRGLAGGAVSGRALRKDP